MSQATLRWLVVGFILPGLGAAEAQARTVVVDCGRGESIGDALTRPGRPLVVRVRGICRENVIVERDDVVLQGADPAADGVRARDDTRATLRVRDARDVRVERLSIGDGSPGLWLDRASEVVIEDTQFVDNVARAGIRAEDSTAVLRRVTVSRNGFRGVDVLRSWVIFSDSTITDNVSPGAGEGIVAQLTSSASLINCTVAGSTAVAVHGGSVVHAQDSTIEGGTDPAHPIKRAVSIVGGSRGSFGRGSLRGQLEVREKSLLTLLAADQLGGLENLVDGDSFFAVHQSRLAAATRFATFGSGTFTSGAEPAALSCDASAGAICTAGVVVPASTCALCPAAP
jgi:hypothetical protein